LVPIEVHYMEKKAPYNGKFLFDWRKNDMDILDDMVVS